MLLLLAALPVAWAGIFDTTTTAFVMASAECDLQLTYLRKGILVAIPFVGRVFNSIRVLERLLLVETAKSTPLEHTQA